MGVAFGAAAMPRRREVRCLRRRPQPNGCLCVFQYSVARWTACSISAQASNLRPFSASERRIFHHDPVRLRQAAYVGWTTNAQRGRARTKSTSVALWMGRLSSAACTCAAAGSIQPSTWPRTSARFAVSPKRFAFAAAALVGGGERGACCRAEGAEDAALAAPAAVDLLAGPLCGRCSRPDHAVAGIAFAGKRSHRVEADDAALGRRGVELLDRPLLRVSSGSTRAPNQVSC
jgi:hypothetical protein